MVPSPCPEHYGMRLVFSMWVLGGMGNTAQEGLGDSAAPTLLTLAISSTTFHRCLGGVQEAWLPAQLAWCVSKVSPSSGDFGLGGLWGFVAGPMMGPASPPGAVVATRERCVCMGGGGAGGGKGR